MKRKLLILLCMILPAVHALSEQNFEEVFPVFLAGLTKRNEELKTLTMPDVEIVTIPKIDSQALYIIDLQTPRDAQVFVAAQEKEGLDYGSFPDDELRLVLFYEDMIVFIFRAFIGL
jgi:hypothetical protein